MRFTYTHTHTHLWYSLSVYLFQSKNIISRLLSYFVNDVTCFNWKIYIQQSTQLAYILESMRSRRTMWRDLKNSIEKIENAELNRNKTSNSGSKRKMKNRFLLTGKHSFTMKYIEGAQFNLKVLMNTCMCLAHSFGASLFNHILGWSMKSGFN